MPDVEQDYEIVGTLEERVAKLRPGATKKLALELLDEMQTWRRLSNSFEERAKVAEAWRAGVEHVSRLDQRIAR